MHNFGLLFFLLEDQFVHVYELVEVLCLRLYIINYQRNLLLIQNRNQTEDDNF